MWPSASPLIAGNIAGRVGFYSEKKIAAKSTKSCRIGRLGDRSRAKQDDGVRKGIRGWVDELAQAGSQGYLLSLLFFLSLSAKVDDDGGGYRATDAVVGRCRHARGPAA
jgi:hypothetical protein